jgi:anthranilate synthase component 1
MEQTSLNVDWLKLKPSESVLAVDCDHYKLFYALKSRFKSSYMFESLALPRHQDRYFAIGFDPAIEFVAKGDSLRIYGRRDAMALAFSGSTDGEVILSGLNPFEFLKKHVPMKFRSRGHQGGLIGYFCYESVNYFESAVSFEEHPDFATFHLGLYTDGLILDIESGVLRYYTYWEDRSSEVSAILSTLETISVPNRLDSVKVMGHSETKEEHHLAVENTLNEVRSGNSFQSEVGFKTLYEIRGDKIAVYNKLREINPSPYMFYIVFDDIELMGASPEILISNSNRRVLTTPTAGTIHRCLDDPVEDRRLARQLLMDPKEISEHNMLVDLHRNDISRVCKIGSVKVEDLMYIIRFSHVQHIVSNIVGELNDEMTGYDVLACILPGGVCTGAPKIETMKIIDRNENTPRGPYGGAVGRFSFNGDSVFCLPIRSLFCVGDSCFTQTSSGVVLDSVPDKEYREITHKLAAMQQTLQELANDTAVAHR